MEQPSFVIFASDRVPWHMGIVSSQSATVLPVETESTDLSQIATTIRQQISAQGYRHGGVVLALPSSQCLCGRIELEGLPRQNRRQAMLYRLEEKLPLAAEDIVGDFVTAGAGAFGVVVQIAVVRPWIEALEQAGIAVECICPAAFLAAQALAAHAETKAPDATPADSILPDALLLQEGETWDLLILKEGKPRSWYSLPADWRQLKLRLDVLTLQTAHPMRLMCGGLDEQTQHQLEALEDVDLLPIAAEKTAQLALEAVPAVVAGRRTPWVNLRQDALAPLERYRAVRAPLTAAMAAAVLFLLCVSVAFLWRTHRYNRWADRQEQRQRQIFLQIFPDQHPPASILRRMRSEMRKLQSVSGQGGDLPSQASALNLLYETLRRLPQNLRYRLVDMRFEGNGIYLEGEARSHADADAIAAALRRQNGFEVDPPRSEQLDGQKVSFTLNGTFHSSQIAGSAP